MDKETENYFNELNMMFSSEGWKTFKQEIEATARNVDRLGDVKDANELFFRKGQLVILGNILNFENQVAAAQAEADESSE